MTLHLFLLTLLVCIATVTVAMLYLRSATQNVIVELCGTRAAANFWLRSADILAYSGSLMLVLIFSSSHTESVAETIRLSLILSLAGIFLTVAFVTKSIWKRVANIPGAQP